MLILKDHMQKDSFDDYFVLIVNRRKLSLN